MIRLFQITDIIRETGEWIILEVLVGLDGIYIVVRLIDGRGTECVSYRFYIPVFFLGDYFHLRVRIVGGNLLRNKCHIIAIGDSIKWHLSLIVHNFQRDFRMIEDIVQKRFFQRCLGNLVDTFIENGHNTRFFLEILLGFLFLVELGIGTRKSYPHKHQFAGCVDFIH
ncbi:MAG: hypothetical protein ACD_78C00306G0004 [uncultured bacterium (gcode 4)]|uniref:Uncharacterized protein n=1 Tax=uncultured bacterium (gcode 4) TaxID=1234023 RepID=K1YBK2_9BACT|nr:MAG: hypothetical protein ACD_78C00306G0004 [uncultured bacterium (gcode 4)]